MQNLIITIALLAATFHTSCAQQQTNAMTQNGLPDGMYAHFYTTKGEIVVSLEFEKTPLTVANFVALAEGKQPNQAKPAGVPFFDGIKFHRVIADFMIQGGDPKGTGQGGPGYNFPDEFHPDLKHSGPGILSMANAGAGTNGSQFFITHKETPWLDNKHSVFGHVVRGQEVVNAIAQNDLMDSVRINRIGKAAKAFDAPKVFKQAQEDLKAAEEAKKANSEKEFLDFVKKNHPTAKATGSGLYYIIERVGSGPSPVTGKEVSVHYTGFLTDGTKFDSSLDRGEPITFPIGAQRVIPGWDEGIMLLKQGGKGRLIIPYHLAYGERGFPPVIPPLATLVFEVELVKAEQ